MALIRCPECGKEISDKADFCVSCGCPANEWKFEKRDTTSNKPTYSSIVVGDTLVFGSYPQTKFGQLRPIEWLVLDKYENEFFLISKYALDCKPYDDGRESITWENCTLREWLNNEFFDEGFSTDEKTMIQYVTVPAERNSEYDTNPGDDTVDRVFLLSVGEVKKYFPADESRICAPTEYAVRQDAEEYDNGCYWWLRSPGEDGSSAACIDNDYGFVDSEGLPVSESDVAVRPAIWVTLES